MILTYFHTVFIGILLVISTFSYFALKIALHLQHKPKTDQNLWNAIVRPSSCATMQFLSRNILKYTRMYGPKWSKVSMLWESCRNGSWWGRSLTRKRKNNRLYRDKAGTSLMNNWIIQTKFIHKPFLTYPPNEHIIWCSFFRANAKSTSIFEQKSPFLCVWW